MLLRLPAVTVTAAHERAELFVEPPVHLLRLASPAMEVEVSVALLAILPAVLECLMCRTAPHRCPGVRSGGRSDHRTIGRSRAGHDLGTQKRDGRNRREGCQKKGSLETRPLPAILLTIPPVGAETPAFGVISSMLEPRAACP